MNENLYLIYKTKFLTITNQLFNISFLFEHV